MKKQQTGFSSPFIPWDLFFFNIPSLCCPSDNSRSPPTPGLQTTFSLHDSSKLCSTAEGTMNHMQDLSNEEPGDHSMAGLGEKSMLKQCLPLEPLLI